jgi:hypothetical protein
MPNLDQQAVIEKAHQDRQRCREWLMPHMEAGKPKAFTKEQYRQFAIAELGAISKASFDYAWIWAIEDSNRQDWYDPLPQRKETKQ